MDTDLIFSSAEARQEARETYWMDIVIERTGTFDDSWPSLNLAEIWLFQDQAVPFRLRQTSPRNWETTVVIGLSNKVETHCVVKTSDGNDLALAYLESNEMCVNGLGLEPSKKYRKEMEVCDAEVALDILWELSIIPFTIPHGQNVTTPPLKLQDVLLVRTFFVSAKVDQPSGSVERPRSQGCRTMVSSSLPAAGAVYPRLIKVTMSLPGGGRLILNQGVDTILTPEESVAWTRTLHAVVRSFIRQATPTAPDDRRIALVRLAVQFTVRGDPFLPALLTLLGSYLGHIYESTLRRSYLEASEAVMRTAARLTPADGPHLLVTLGALGCTLLRCCRYTRSLIDVEEAISVLQAAAKVASTRHVDLPRSLDERGDALMLRFELTGRLSDIDESIATHRRALGSTGKVGNISGLGSALGMRFRHTGDLSDLEEGILSLQRAVELTPDDKVVCAPYLCSLGLLLESRFICTRDMSDIAEAISAHQPAMDAIPKGHPNLYIQLENLARTFSQRWKSTRDLPDIHEAVSLSRRALELALEWDPDPPRTMCHLANNLNRLWEATGYGGPFGEKVNAQN